MAKKVAEDAQEYRPHTGKPSALLDTRVIYCGDNLDLLPKLPDGCVDLIYIDPPFNSNRNYEVFWGEKKEKRSFEDRHESTKAYIEFMQPRCVELHRVLKPTGSFYYHCDWHASHYVKVTLDRIFGENNFQNEIVWKRSDAHSDAKQGAKHFGRVHDSIFFYTVGKTYTFNSQYNPLPKSTVEKWYRHVEEGTGRRYNMADVTGPGGAAKGCPVFEWKGVTRAWRYSKDNMERLEREGRLAYSKTGMVYQKRFLDESKGVPLQSWWDDIGMLRGINRGTERLGYPTQKPLPLLERIINASSNPNDVVLDAFCGCGTALVAAEKLGRQWIGIDMSPTACRVMAKRLRDVCKLREGEALRAAGKGFAVRCLPFTEETLRKMPPFEFQNWAVNALGAVCGPRGADGGIDGRFFFADSPPTSDPSALGFMDDWYPVQVKQEDKAGRPEIMSFEAVMTRDKRKTGYFVAFSFSQDALDEARRFMLSDHRHIIPLTVTEILDGSFAEKMA